MGRKVETGLGAREAGSEAPCLPVLGPLHPTKLTDVPPHPAAVAKEVDDGRRERDAQHREVVPEHVVGHQGVEQAGEGGAAWETRDDERGDEGSVRMPPFFAIDREMRPSSIKSPAIAQQTPHFHFHF